MAWRQSPGGSEQHLTRAAAAARTRTQRPGKHLAVHASELVVKPDFQILRRHRRPLLLRLEHTHRPTLEDYVHRATRLGSSRSLNLRIGVSCPVTSSASRLVLLNWPPPDHLWIGTKSRHVLLPQRVTAETAAQTRIVSVDRIRLDPWKSVRPFKGIFCHDISEFESYMPSHAVRSPPAKMCDLRCPSCLQNMAFERKNANGQVHCISALVPGRLRMRDDGGIGLSEGCCQRNRDRTLHPKGWIVRSDEPSPRLAIRRERRFTGRQCAIKTRQRFGGRLSGNRVQI